MSQCILGHDYAIVYELFILPRNPESLADKHEKGELYQEDVKKWFNDELQVGKNRPLMKDFEEMAKQNEDQGDEICFLIQLSQTHALEELATKQNFTLKLLKSGELLQDEFRAPQKIYKIVQNKKFVDYAELEVPISHANKHNLPVGDRFNYELWVDYWTMDNKVSIY